MSKEWDLIHYLRHYNSQAQIGFTLKAAWRGDGSCIANLSNGAYKVEYWFDRRDYQLGKNNWECFEECPQDIDPDLLRRYRGEAQWIVRATQLHMYQDMLKGVHPGADK